MPAKPLSAIAAERGLIGGPFGSSLVSKDYVLTGIPVIRGANMGFGRFIGGEYAFVSTEKFERDLSRNTAAPGDIVYTQRGTLGQVSLVPPGPIDTYVVSQSQMRLRVDGTKAVPEFVYYASTTPQFLKQIEDRAISTGVPHTNLGILSALEIPLPPLPEQQAIAEVLGALDDKIAANTALAATADELVRAEYASLDAPTVRVGDVADSPRSGVDPSTVDPGSLYVGLEHIGRRNVWLTEGGRAEEVSSGKSRFEARDVLFGKLRPYFHKVVAAPRSGICSTDVLVVRSRDPLESSVLLAALSSDRVIEEVVSASEGTRMPRTSWKDLAAVEVRWPEPEVVGSIASRLDGLRDATWASLAENRTLAATRDALLPQLMLGKLRVRDAERLASDAGA
ncbi:restriction endonuclease subunit S [Microbacterium sp. SSW1-59]|uniref:restriction endonuclease subunit S n=1 Tax=Microbacterium xanthum TaxID=3079794 RepID=UPI002AD1DE31|nr:restriction endonuclease subunit S [Microbacterium sp. SSW1-59]MDZ8200758.1 restriction endonuclease subunit S [Microbacterium sp. SSW1-59]